MPPPGLSDLYAELVVTGDLPDEIWDEWLWQTDPEQPYAQEVLMNRCQLLGFLVCLCKGMEVRPEQGAIPDHRLTIMDKPVASMSLSELKDTIHNLQVEWPEFLRRLSINPNAQENLDAVIFLIDECAARFGVLCLHAYQESVLDDLCSIEAFPGPDGLYQISHECIRRTVCTFLIIYRHLHLLAVCKTVPGEWIDCGISKYHIEASGDDFNTLCMHMALPVAAKLNYKHDYPGMYNHVLQAVFFHNPEYKRIPRVKLADISTASVEHVLPALMQLHPAIGLKYEEDEMDLTKGQEGGNWFWIVVPGRVYLVDPERTVWYSPDITSLLNVYLSKQQQ